ncbi:MAG: hypothetical protein A2231_08655 [Candidatus Firestonebacteria bacterium RIFOXYA2_FULL_40_8]|nr:MAG: hypothetical protein A2231_08655 [Candidatus Firestonebacteria bacterium RIFOXYA2_FULL_40_8]
MKTTSIIFPKANTVELWEEEVGELKDDEVIIKTSKSLISIGTETVILKGNYTDQEKSEWARFPFHAGYSNVGVIYKTGKNIKGFREGDRVITGGIHSTYVKAPAKDLLLVPADVSDEEATFGILGRICLAGIRLSKIELGDNIVVYGLGLIGQIAMQLSRINGGVPLIGVELSDFRSKVAKQLGCDYVFNPKNTDVAAEIMKITENRGADIIFETTGAPKVFPETFKAAKRQGKIILMSSPHGSVQVDLQTDLHTRGLNIIGAHTSNVPSFEEPSNRWTEYNNRKLFLQLISKKMINVKGLITDRYKYTDAGSVYKKLLENRDNTLGIILEW